VCSNLRLKKKQWDSYEKAVQGLLITQLQYVLTAGSNRWEAHEIKNVRVMVSWFLKGPRLDCGSDQPQINKAAERYKDDWEKKQPRTDGADYGDDGGRANLPSTD
jgi:hypothetical protein